MARFVRRAVGRWLASIGSRLGSALVSAAAVLGQARGAFARWSFAARGPVRGQLETRGGPVDGSVYSEQWAHVLQGWDYDSYFAAQSMAESGDLMAIADFCTSIMGSPRASADLRTRTLAITGAQISFDKAPSGRRARASVRAMGAEEDWFYMMPEPEQSLFMKWQLVLGVALARLNWWEDSPAAATPEAARDLPKVARIRNGRNVPLFETWHPRCLRWDWIERLWFVRLDDGTEEAVRDGMNGWVLWTSSASRPWLNGLWRALGPMLLLMNFAIADWRDQGEKYAQGVAVFTGPGAHDPEMRVQLVREWREAGARGAVYLPEKTDLKIFELAANTWATYQAQIALANTSITIAILGSNLPTEVSSSGAGTGATAQQEVRNDIKAGDARAHETFVHMSITRLWAWANFQDADVAPWITIHVQPKEDAARVADAANKAALAMQNLYDMGAPFDDVAFMQSVNLPVDQAKVGQPRRVRPAAWMITSGIIKSSEAAEALGYEVDQSRGYYDPQKQSAA